MRQSSSGPLTTILMLVPLVVVPLLAMFGLPSFSSNDGAQSPELQINQLLGQPSGGPGDIQPHEIPSSDPYAQNTLAAGNMNAGRPSLQVGMTNPSTPLNGGYGHSSNQMNPTNNAVVSNANSNALGLTAGDYDQNGGAQAPAMNNPQPGPPQNGMAANGGGVNQATLPDPNFNLGLGGNTQNPSPQDPNGTFPARNPFVAETAPAPNSNVANNGQSQPANSGVAPAAFDPGALDAEDDAFPQLSEVPVTNPPANPVANAGFNVPGAQPGQSNQQIAQMSGENATNAFAPNSAGQQPGPAHPAANNIGPQPAPNGGTSNNAGPKPSLDWQSAVKLLNYWGIDNFVLQPGASAGQFHFSCHYTHPADSRISHRFEAESSEPLKAVENVLQQIQQWHIQQQQQQSVPQNQ